MKLWFHKICFFSAHFLNVQIISRLSTGGEFLLQATDDAGVNSWLSALGGQSAAAGGSAPRAHTLPPPQKDEQKRRSFFTLKKK